MEAPDHESSRADFCDDGYQDEEVESTFHQPSHDHGEQGPGSPTRESDGERGDDGVRVHFQSTFPQPPVDEKYRKRHFTSQEQLSDSESADDDQIGVSINTAQHPYKLKVEAIEMPKTFTSSFYPGPYEKGNQTVFSELALEGSTRRPYSEVGNQIIESTFTEASGGYGEPNLLPTSRQYIIRNGSEEPQSTIQRSSRADGTKKLQSPIEEVHFRVQNHPSLTAPPNDGSGERDQPLQVTIEQGWKNKDERREQDFVNKREGIQFLQQSGQFMYPSAASDEYQARTTYMEGSDQEQADAHRLEANSNLVNLMLSQEQNDGVLPAQLAHLHADHGSWYNSFLSMSLQNGWCSAQNPSGGATPGECSSCAIQEMAVNLHRSESLSVASLGFITPMSTSAPQTFSRSIPPFTPAEADGDSSQTQPVSAVAVQMPSHDQWAACCPQTQDDTGLSKYKTLDLVSQMTSSQFRLMPLSSQDPDDWRDKPLSINLALQNASAQMSLPPLLRMISPASIEAAATGWGWPNAYSTVPIPSDVAENMTTRTAAGPLWNSRPHVPVMHRKYFEESRHRRQLHHRWDGDVEHVQIRSEFEDRREEVETSSYQGADEKQQQCSCEECRVHKGTGTVMTAEGGYGGHHPQCACGQCQLQIKAIRTGIHLASEGDDGHEKHPQEEQYQTRLAMGFEGVHVYQREELQMASGAGYSSEGNDEQQGQTEGRGYATDYDRSGQHQVQIDHWQRAFSDQQYYHSQSEQMQSGEEQQEEWDSNFEGYDEMSERWQEGHAWLKQKLTLWKKARFRARIVTHPLFPHLLQAHVECIRMMTPANKQDEINQQLENVQTVYDKYLPFAPRNPQEDDIHIDHFLKKLLVDIKNYQTALENNIKVQATPTYAHLWRTERALFQLTGIRIPDQLKSGPTMSDDSENDGGDDSDTDMAEGALDGLNHNHDCTTDGRNYGSYGPTAADRAAIETIRQELIEQLGLETYRKQIKTVRDEILRKRRAGKLPEGTTGVLKAWWDAHSKWPYPTEDEKEQLINATGLELKQVNNWFINQRKRNWHNNPLALNNKDKPKGDVIED